MSDDTSAVVGAGGDYSSEDDPDSDDDMVTLSEPRRRPAIDHPSGSGDEQDAGVMPSASSNVWAGKHEPYSDYAAAASTSAASAVSNKRKHPTAAAAVAPASAASAVSYKRKQPAAVAAAPSEAASAASSSSPSPSPSDSPSSWSSKPPSIDWSKGCAAEVRCDEVLSHRAAATKLTTALKRPVTAKQVKSARARYRQRAHAAATATAAAPSPSAAVAEAQAAASLLAMMGRSRGEGVYSTKPATVYSTKPATVYSTEPATLAERVLLRDLCSNTQRKMHKGQAAINWDAISIQWQKSVNSEQDSLRADQRVYHRSKKWLTNHRRNRFYHEDLV